MPSATENALGRESRSVGSKSRTVSRVAVALEGQLAALYMLLGDLMAARGDVSAKSCWCVNYDGLM
jgi:hypothetical protein